MAAPTTKPTIPFLNLPPEIRQQILLHVLTDRDIKNTTELKAHKLSSTSQIPLYEAKWHQEPIPQTNPQLCPSQRTMCGPITATHTSPLQTFVLRWNVPAPLFHLDHSYISKVWIQKQESSGREKVAAWNGIFGSQFPINWTRHYAPFPEQGEQRLICVVSEVSPVGVTAEAVIGMDRGLVRLSSGVEVPRGLLGGDAEGGGVLGGAVERRRLSRSWKTEIRVRGFIKVDGEM